MPQLFQEATNCCDLVRSSKGIESIEYTRTHILQKCKNLLGRKTVNLLNVSELRVSPINPKEQPQPRPLLFIRKTKEETAY
jgi:hypothetical protein